MDIVETREVKEYAMFITEGLAKEESLHPIIIEQAVKRHNITILRWEVRESSIGVTTDKKTYALIWYGYENN